MKKTISWLLPIAWMGVIFYSSAQPYQDQDVKPLLEDMIDLSFLEPILSGIAFVYHYSEVSVANLGVYGFIEFFIRKGAHVGVFFVLFLLFYLAFVQTFTRGKWNMHFAFILTVVYAALDEWHQGFTPNRTPYVGDVLLDSIGAMIGVGLLLLIFWWRNKKLQ